MLRYRLLTAVIAIPLLVWFILCAPAWTFILLVLTATFIALREFAEMAVGGIPYATTMTTVGGMLVALAMSIDQSGAATTAGIVVSLTATLLLTLALARDDMQESVDCASRVMLGTLYAGILLPHFIWLRALPGTGPAWTFFVVAVAMAGDVGGYFGGRALGRTKLWPTVSPKKTVEGAATSLVCSLIAGVLVNAILLHRLGFLEVLLVSAVAGILAQLGDLLESMLKRAFDVKDSGWILPGHGGVLDRTDSLVLPVVFVYYYALLALS